MLPPFCSREEQERFPQQCGWEFDLLHSGIRIPFMAHATHPGHRGITWPKVCRLPKSAKLTDLQGDSEQEQRFLNHAASMALPASWYAGSFLAHRTIYARLGRYKRLYQKDSRRRSYGNEWFGYAEPRAIPSLCILNCRVDRFIARCAAAPWGPATTQLLSLRAFRICWRSVSCKRS
jgi:hypothetical protein